MKTAVRRLFRLGWPTVALLLVLVVAGAVVGFFVARFDESRIVRGVSVAGVSVGRLSAKEAKSLLRVHGETLGREPVTFTYADSRWSFAPLSVGLRPDYDASIRAALRVGRRGGLLACLRERRLIGREGLDLPIACRVDRSVFGSLCQVIEDEVNQEPVSAHVTVDPAGKISLTPSADGHRLDRTKLRGVLERSYEEAKGRRYELPVLALRPLLSDDDVKDWPLDQVLGFYVTKFDARDAQRTHNLGMAAAALDGQIVRPGGQFSFNEHVGPRVPEKGYMEAPVLQKNRLALGIGGGVCQVSGTLFNAILLANLAITKRSSHSLPSSYVPLGRDATVVYDAVDFVFTNDVERPVVIAAGIAGSRLVVAVVGHREAKPSVKIAVEVKETIPFETVVENDPGLAAGVEAVTQEGRNGYKVELWRTATWPDRRMRREQIGTASYYPPVKKIIKRGIGSPRFGNWTPPRPEQSPPAEPPAVGNP